MSVPESQAVHRPAPNRLLWIVALALGALWIGYLAILGPRRDGVLPGVDGLVLGGSTYSWRFQDLEGNPAALADFKGKTIFLNLWATWCGPCIVEMPSIERLASNESLRRRGVVVLAVATGGEDAETVRRFVAERGFSSIRFYRSEDVPPPAFRTEGIPATFLIAPDGRVAARQVGAIQWDTPQVVALLEKLSEPPKVVVGE